MTRYSSYKIVRITEGAIGTLLLGASSLPLKRIEETLNDHAADWELVFMFTEKSRYMLFWTREAVIAVLGRP